MTTLVRVGAARGGGELEPLYQEALASFSAQVTSIPDPFGLMRPDTPEMPRYLATLDAAKELARGRGDAAPLRVCDLGGYFGIITAAIARLGFRGDLVDSYGPLLEGEHTDLREWWADNDLTVRDVDLQAADLRLPFDDDTFDLVTLLAVIEHFPNTPRLVLEEMRRIVKPGGIVVVDTPNAGDLGLRVGFARHGEGLWTPVEEVYFSDVPFHGHSRCYSRRELLQVLDWAGFDPVEVRMFDLAGEAQRRSLLGRVLYDHVQPRLAKRFPDLHGYLWISAQART
jgi:SAM-dependent methyltransferase